MVARDVRSCDASLYVTSRGNTRAPPYGFIAAEHFPFDPVLNAALSVVESECEANARHGVRAAAVQALARRAAEVTVDDRYFAELISRSDDERLIKRSIDARYFIARWLRANDRRETLRASKTVDRDCFE